MVTRIKGVRVKCHLHVTCVMASLQILVDNVVNVINYSISFSNGIESDFDFHALLGEPVMCKCYDGPCG